MNHNNLLIPTSTAQTSTDHSSALQTVLWTALVTPFTANNSIDFDSLTVIATKQAQAGNGILLLGSTGEGLALTRDEHQQIVEFVCQLNLNTPLMVAVGGYNLTEQIAWVKQCHHYAIDAFLLGTPIYAKPGAVGQTHWFEQLLDATNLPCMLYNVPSRSGVEIPLQTVINLAEHPNFWAMKEASGDINKFLAYRQAVPNVAIFSGEDSMMPYLANAGACGLVSVCANAWPEATKYYVELSLLGQTQALFPLWHNAIASLFSVANPIPVKMLMHCQNEISLPNLRAPLTHLELESTSTLLSIDLQIDNWLDQQNNGVKILKNSSLTINQAIGA